MPSKDIYNTATVYNPVETHTKAPRHSHSNSRPSSSHHAAPSSSRPSSSAASKTHTTLERDNSPDRASSSRTPRQHTTLQRDRHAPSSSHGNTPVHQNYTLLNRDQQSSSSSRQPSSMRAPASTAPPGVQSKFKTQHDVEMATKQTSYHTMNHEEKKKQDEWVSHFIKYAGPCPAGFGWERVRDGYVCNGGNHLCTDDLLAEGKGGFYCGTLDAGWWGPMYDLIDYDTLAEEMVYEYAKKHGLDPTVAPVVPDPQLPATGEVHPGIAKAMAGLGPMPQPCPINQTHERFTRVGQTDRDIRAMTWGDMLYGRGGRPNRLIMSTSDGSLQSALSHGGLLSSHGHVSYGHGSHNPGPYGPSSHMSGYSGQGYHSPGPYLPGPYGRRRY